MPEGYLHLTCEQRSQIYALLQSGHSQAHIARQIGVDPSTISRELVRNTGARGYRCAFRRSRPLVPTHRDHLFRTIATSMARGMRAPSGASADFSVLVWRQA